MTEMIDNTPLVHAEELPDPYIHGHPAAMFLRLRGIVCTDEPDHILAIAMRYGYNPQEIPEDIVAYPNNLRGGARF